LAVQIKYTGGMVTGGTIEFSIIFVIVVEETGGRSKLVFWHEV